MWKAIHYILYTTIVRVGLFRTCHIDQSIRSCVVCAFVTFGLVFVFFLQKVLDCFFVRMYCTHVKRIIEFHVVFDLLSHNAGMDGN